MSNGADGGLGGAGADAGVGGPSDVGSCSGTCDAGVPLPAGVPPPPVVTPYLTPMNPVVLVKKPYTNPARKEVILLADDPGFDGTGTFTASSGAIRFFTQPNGGVEILSGHVFPGPDLGANLSLWAEGANPSGAMNDVHLTLTLTPGSKPVNPPAHADMTSVEVTLQIHKTRTAVGAADPAMLTIAEKTTKPGRIVHVQNTSFHHGRALLIVRQAVPNAFTGTLILTSENGTVRVFADPQEVAAGGQPSLGNSHDIPNGSILAAGTKFWAEGANVSGAVGDTGFRLGVSGVDPDGDRAKMTVVQFSNLRAVVSSTPPAHPQGGNSPVADHAAFGGGAAPFAGGFAPANYDESFPVNAPLVLIENSLPAGKKVNLSVAIKPRVPVFWTVERNKFGPNADHAQIRKLTGDPTIAPLKTDTLNATIQLDAVGSFSIRPFVDIDGGGNNEFHDATGNRIDREPYIIMNLILVRAQGFKNLSKKLATVPPLAPLVGGGAVITAATGVRVSTNTGGAAAAWTGPTCAAWNKARITLIGGGPQGRWGLDNAAAVKQRVFAGWSQCLEAANVVTRYLDATVAPPAPHVQRIIRATNSPTTLTPTYKPGVFRLVGSGPAPGGLPSSTALPTLATLPLLDVSPFANPGTGGDTCVGTEGAVGPPIPPGLVTTNVQLGIAVANLPGGGHSLAYGQDWTVEQWDAPGNAALPAPLMFAGSLVEFNYEYRFRTDLVVWTNITGVSGATNHAANRLYATVQTDHWTIQLHMRFDPPGSPTAGTAHVVTKLAFQMKPDNTPTRVASAVEGSGEELRFPIGLACYAIDART
jgi:hypothetical protein